MSQESTELVRAAYAALERRDLDGFLALIYPDVEFESLIAEMEGGSYRGHDGVRKWWRSMAEALGGMRFELEQIESFRDRVIMRLVVSGTLEGVEVTHRQWGACRVREGLIAWWAIFRTEAEALAAVGLRE